MSGTEKVAQRRVISLGMGVSCTRKVISVLTCPANLLLTFIFTQLFAGKTAEFDLTTNPLTPLKRPEVMNSLWDDVWVIVSECWQEDTAKRPSADEIVSRLGSISLEMDEPSEGIQLLMRLKFNLKGLRGQRSTN